MSDDAKKQEQREREQREHEEKDPNETVGVGLVNGGDYGFLSSHPEVGTSIESRRVYTWNKTGNLYFSTTNAKFDDKGMPIWSTLNDDVKKCFQEVCVFWASLTKALVKANKSIFDHGCVDRAVRSSGLFDHMTKEKLRKVTDSFGLTFSKEVVGAMVGLGTGVPFAASLVNMLGNESVKVGQEYSNTDSKMCHVCFICEEIFDLPVISVMIISIDTEQVKRHVTAGPCLSYQRQWTTLTMEKDTYLFVQPESIELYSGRLLKAISNEDLAAMTEKLKEFIENKEDNNQGQGGNQP